MTREQFAQLVDRIEQRLGRRPAALRMRVVALALLSYAGLLAWLALAFLLAAPFFVAGFFTLPDPAGGFYFLIGGAIAALGIVTTVNTLRVRIEPPEGLTLRPADAPKLFATLAEIRANLRAAPVYRVTLSWSCNAGVSAVPRLGLLGWPRHHLELGLPLMEVLSEDEFNSVLAHEFAHISGQHGRISGWVYRLRRSWTQAFERGGTPRASRGALHRGLLKFFDWFWPRFSAHAFVLSRLHEFEADAVAARLYGRGPATSALLSIQLHGRLLNEEFWPGLWRNPTDDARPPADVFHRLRASLDAGVPAARAGQWLHESFRVFTSHDDTHPCLTERWRALGRVAEPEGADAVSPALTPESSARAFFGANLESVRQRLAEAWSKAAAEHWQVSQARTRMFREQSDQLSQLTVEHEADVLWDRAQATLEFAGEAEAALLWREVLARRPGHPLANLYLGRHLINHGNPEGEAHLERALAADENLITAVGGILTDHFTRNGQTERVREWRARLDRHDARVAASHAERNSVTAADRFIAHALSAGELAEARRILAAEPEVESAFLARKDLRHFPEQRLFVLVVRLARRWYAPPSAAKSSAVVGRLIGKVRLPGRLLIVGEQGGFAAVARKVKLAPESRFYQIGLVEPVGEGDGSGPTGQPLVPVENEGVHL